MHRNVTDELRIEHSGGRLPRGGVACIATGRSTLDATVLVVSGALLVRTRVFGEMITVNEEEMLMN